MNRIELEHKLALHRLLSGNHNSHVVAYRRMLRCIGRNDWDGLQRWSWDRYYMLQNRNGELKGNNS